MRPKSSHEINYNNIDCVTFTLGKHQSPYNRETVWAWSTEAQHRGQTTNHKQPEKFKYRVIILNFIFRITPQKVLSMVRIGIYLPNKLEY